MSKFKYHKFRYRRRMIEYPVIDEDSVFKDVDKALEFVDFDLTKLEELNVRTREAVQYRRRRGSAAFKYYANPSYYDTYPEVGSTWSEVKIRTTVAPLPPEPVKEKPAPLPTVVLLAKPSLLQRLIDHLHFWKKR